MKTTKGVLPLKYKFPLVTTTKDHFILYHKPANVMNEYLYCTDIMPSISVSFYDCLSLYKWDTKNYIWYKLKENVLSKEEATELVIKDL